MLFHAFEAATDGAYEMYVNPDMSKMEARLDELVAFHNRAEVEQLEAVAVGTVEADDVDSALSKIRAGDWQHKQRMYVEIRSNKKVLSRREVQERAEKINNLLTSMDQSDRSRILSRVRYFWGL